MIIVIDDRTSISSSTSGRLLLGGDRSLSSSTSNYLTLTIKSLDMSDDTTSSTKG